ncbi:MAG: hypothetical protein WC998_04440 [Candidatus Paceibacterota bacterium]|jgi:hypothetical protein
MVKFKIVNSIFKKEAVEILSDDGNVIGVRYSTETDKEIKIVSAHISQTTTENQFAGEVLEDNGIDSWPPIPAVIIKFDPSPYIIMGNQIIKVKR